MTRPSASASSSAKRMSFAISSMRKPKSKRRLSTGPAAKRSVGKERPEEALSTLTMSSGSSPAFTPMAMASQAAAQVVAASRLLTSFKVCPCPTASPTNTVLEPITSSTGRTRSNAARSPDAMTESVPASAPAMPPLTGASSETTPRGASPSATSRATRAPVVERST